MENPFHDAGSIFPDEVELVTIPPDTRIGEALRLMLERRFSQLPVVEHGEVLGVFSLLSLAHHLSMSSALKVQTVLQELEVGEMMERLPTVTVKDSLHTVLNQLERHEALLMGSAHGLQAVVTSTDVLRYFYRVARPYILLQEIELGLRLLIEMYAPGDRLRECIQRALAKAYEARGSAAPEKLEEMSFEDYRSIITASQNWPLFNGALGHNRDLVSAKLERLRTIRNEVFHFRSKISVLDYQTLVNARDWLLGKLDRGTAAGSEDRHV